MIVVSDTTPLISLMKINRLNLLEKLYGSVSIPKAVFDELTSNEIYHTETEFIIQSKFIECREIINKQALQILQAVTSLDLGESEAIILAQELNADVLLMDESKGRKIAQKLNIPLSGVLGILIDCFDVKLLTASEVSECLDILQNSGRRISGHLINKVRDYINE